MDPLQKAPLNRRALIALVLVCSFVSLPISGLALHYADHAPFQPVRHLLMTVHDLDAIIFLIATALHLKLNWKPLLNYIKYKQRQASHIRSEVRIATVIVASPLILGILHVFMVSRG